MKEVKIMKSKQNHFLFFIFIGLVAAFFVNEVQAAPPVNDDLQNLQIISGTSGSVNGSTVDATRQTGEPSHLSNLTPVYRTVWFEWTAAETKPVVFQTTYADFDPVIAVHVGDNGFQFPESPSRNNDTFGTYPRVEFGAVAGKKYKIVVGLFNDPNAQGGDFTLEWATYDTPTNDDFENSLFISPIEGGSVTLTKLNATKQTGEPAHIAGNRSLWFEFTNDTETDYSITFSTLSFDLTDTTLAVYTGGSVDNLTPVVKNDNVSSSLQSRVTFLAKANVTYRIAVDEGSNSNGGSSLLNWEITKLKGYTDFAFKDEQTKQVFYDDAAEIAVFRPSDGVWYWLNSFNNTFNAVQFGISGDTPVPTDYDGDGITDLAVARNTGGEKIWWIRNSSDGSYEAAQWGLSGDKVMPGDYDYDGRADLAVFRPGDNVWYIRRSSDGELFSKEFGLPGDIPVLGDFKNTPPGTDLAVFRPSNGTWYIFDGVNTIFLPFGTSGDKPVVGDYDSDGKSDVAVYRPSDGIWYILRSRTNQVQFVQWGLPDDIPLTGDFDNNSNDPYDFAVFRPTDRTWYIRKAEGNQIQYVQFGLSGDIPVSSLNHLTQ